MDYLIQYIQQILSWVLQFVDWCFYELFQLISNACAVIIAAIPLPSFVTNAATMIGNLPPGLLFFAQMLELQQGLQIIFVAVGLRFMIRRIPFVG